MIRPKEPKPTAREERQAYRIATTRDSDTCQRCLRDCGATARDHRQNRQAGNTRASNLQVLGLRCHQWKTEHPKDALADGWACPSWALPGEWPARRWIRAGPVHRAAWVLYDDDGDWFEITDHDAARRMEGGRSWPGSRSTTDSPRRSRY